MMQVWLGVVAASVALTACSGPAVPLPQAQFAGADDAGADAALADAASLDDVPGDGAAVADVPVADVALSDLPPLPDALPPIDAFVPPDVGPGDDGASQPDVLLALDGIFGFDVGPTPDVAVVPACGDGKCAPPVETSTSCPVDCGAPTWTECAQQSCATAWNACQSSGGCSNAAACAQACLDTSCVQACSTDLSYTTLVNALEPLVTCARAHNCLAAANPGPGGGPNTCGNGKCDGGETHLTCPKDCSFPISANEQCQVQNCGDSYGACMTDLGCVTAATCYNQGNSGMCFAVGGGQLLLNLIGCIQQQCP